MVRHGECVHNIKKEQDVLTQRCLLTDKGKEQSIAAAEHIKKLVDDLPDSEKIYLYFSPYSRTKYMATEIFNRVKCDEFCEEPLISEIQCGKFFSEEQYRKDYPQESELLRKFNDAKCRFWYRFKDGESPFDVYVRLRLFLAELKTNENGVAIIVSHNITLRVLAMMLQHKTVEQFDDGKRFANGEVLLIED